MSETRNRIADRIRSHPGIHFNELVRVLDLAPGQVQYHLARLTSNEIVVGEQLYGRTHYYPPTFDRWEQHTIALVRRETARDIILVLLEQTTMRPATVANQLNIARSTLEWHLDRLIAQNIVEKHRDSRNHVSLELANPADTARLLREVQPSLPERLVDRFSRLVDQLLEA